MHRYLKYHIKMYLPQKKNSKKDDCTQRYLFLRPKSTCMLSLTLHLLLTNIYHFRAVQRKSKLSTKGMKVIIQIFVQFGLQVQHLRARFESRKEPLLVIY